MWSSFAAVIKGPILNKVKSRPLDYCERIACHGNYDITHGPFLVS